MVFAQLDDECVAMRRVVARFAEEHIAPYAASWDEAGHFPRELVKPLAELGLMGLTVPQALGGTEASRLASAVVYEALAHADLSPVVWLAVHNMVAGIIATCGTDAQRARYLPGIVAGDTLCAFSLSEAEAGSDVRGIRATARREGDTYVLNGAKLWVSSGNVADVVLVMARVVGISGNAPHSVAEGGGISAFLVECPTPGLIVGEVEKKMGLHASPTVELLFEDCRIPTANRIGEEGQGLRIALGALDGGRINIAAGATGVAQAALDVATRYAQERRQFGRAIAEFQGIQFLLADMATRIDAARLLTYRAAALLDAQGSATKEAAMAKCFATDMAMQVTTDAVQVLGGAGYLRDYPLERYMRDVKVTQIFEGTNQIQRVVIARALLRDTHLSPAS